ncbi:16S rRNA (guanine(527)-N(7))-methyltransferase RsmG [Piscinibacter sp. XHJ-5]|uniref:16S rRNA (guanine(527)-N(7))-methyltransferase RsmG n=1 Tax=Piscinibacter sp. XHJ-5 TaxID=3037797 RepID=UPI002452DD86|nr:16S rRNA (guanine(527)-N(7))-methyltransferase RsmG [Piscinibacter sp. XHJ-5]
MSDPGLDRLQSAAGQLRLKLPTATAEKLLAFLGLLQRWNATYNLTAVRDPEEMLTQHLFDCLAVIGPLRRERGTGPKRVLDVGSGAGFPGVIIATACPQMSVVCVDTVGKKAAFVRQVAMELGLANLQGEHARVEKLRAAPFDVITSRAFASLSDFVGLTRQHLAAGGVWMAMKGKRPEAEIAGLPADVDVFHVEQLDVPQLVADRCLVWMRLAN